MAKQKKKYEIEVHVGLLVLIAIFLGLNLSSNYIIYNAKSFMREQTTNNLFNSALTISRNYQNEIIPDLQEEQIAKLTKAYKLSSLILIPTLPGSASKESKRDWFISIANKLPMDQIPELAQKILSSEYNRITRGNSNEYFFVYPVKADKEKKLLILSRNLPMLAYLDDSANSQFNISIITIFASILIYFLLFRYILAPFKKLKKDAEDAGREVVDELGEVESVVAEYQKIIQELRDKEAELLILNESIQLKADSLEQFNQYLLKSMVAGVITINNDGRVTSLNNAVELILSLQSDQYIDTDYKTLPFLSDEYKKLIEQTLLDNKYHPYKECTFKLSDSRSISLGLTISPVIDNKTAQIGASILMNDLTELKNLQKELEQNRQMVALGEMSAGLAHQLRSSLGAIVGYNTLVKKKLIRQNESVDMVIHMEKELKEAESLIGRFLTFTKPYDYNPEKVNIIDLLKNIIETFSIRSDSSNITFNLKTENQITNVNIDKLLFKQALINIIENSKNAYIDNKGQIELEIIKSANNIELKIIDFGCGIEKDNLDKIFTPFYSSRPSGTGLGLPLAQKIIALHQGRIQVTSEIGEGTVFTIVIPEYDISTDSPNLKQFENYQ